jgi:hypothetical protein
MLLAFFVPPVKGAGVAGKASIKGAKAAETAAEKATYVSQKFLPMKNFNDPYAGVKQASEYLKSQGVPRKYRKQVLESFDVRTISVEVADENTYGLRFYDDINAYAKGRYLFETFTEQINRNNLALPPE